MSYTVYLRTNKVNGMQYVGQTKNYQVRNCQWNNLKTRYTNKYIDEDRRKYGLDAFETSIIAFVKTKEQADDLETMCIKVLNTIYPNGYNLESGGSCGKKHKETKQKMSEARKGKKHPIYGKKQSEETIRKKIEKLSRAVNQYDLEGNFIKRWNSATEAARELGFDQGTIWKCCNKKRYFKTYKGSIWKYADKS